MFELARYSKFNSEKIEIWIIKKSKHFKIKRFVKNWRRALKKRDNSE